MRDAVYFQHHECIEWLISHGAKLNEANTDIATLLHAADDGSVGQVVAMLTAGINVDSQDYDGRSALHLAACAGHVEVVKTLIAQGANASLSDRWGSRPVDDARRYGHSDVVAVLSRGDGDDSAFELKQLPNAGPAEAPPASSSHLLASGRVNATTNTSTVELLAAARIGDVAEIKRLHKKRVDLTMEDYDGRTAIHVAAAAGHLDVIMYLAKQKKANLNVQDNMHQTPLQDAISASHDHIVVWLKAHGAVLMDKMMGSRLCQAAFDSNTAELRKMHQAGVDMSVADYDGRTAMHLASAAGHVHVVKLLLQFSAQLNVKDRWGSTPLTDATKQKQEGVVNLLLASASRVTSGPLAVGEQTWSGGIQGDDESDDDVALLGGGHYES